MNNFALPTAKEIPLKYKRITIGTIQINDMFWNWTEQRFDCADMLVKNHIASDQYIIRKAVIVVPKRTWAKRLAALIISKEK